MPGLILVQHGTAVIEGKRVKLLHIERETEDYIYERNAQKSNGYFPPGIPGRPRKKKQ